MTSSYVSRVEANQYDGTNGTEIIDWVSDLIGTWSAELGYTLSSATESGGVVTVNTTGPDYVVAEGEWLAWIPFGFGVYADLYWPVYYQPLPGLGQLVERVGTAAVPAKALGGSNDVTVTLASPMSGTGFVPDIKLLGSPGIVGGHGVTGWTVVDEDTVTVHITSAVGSLSGATAHVTVREVG